jgi:hypothetical protein
MGRQTGFFTLEEDDQALLELSQKHGMRALPAEVDAGAEIVPAAPLAFDRPTAPMPFYLLPAEVPVDAVTYEPRTAVPRSMLMSRLSPAVQVLPCRREGDAIHDGRVYFDTDVTNPWSSAVRREFERLSRFMKRWPQTDRFHFRVGPAAAAAVRARRMRLVHVGYELALREAVA